jgi:Flp pilus assembly protein TadG
MYLRSLRNAPGTTPAESTRIPPPRPRRSAVAAMEFAVLLPFLIMIVMGMFELGRGMLARETLCNAARKGCRTGILHQYGNPDIIRDVTNIMTDNGYDSTKFNPPSIGTISITVTDPNGIVLADALDAPPGSVVSVQVSIPVTSVAWVTPNFLPATSLESDLMVMMKQ